MRDCRLALLLVPPSLVGQLVTEYELVGQHFKMPSLVVHGRNYSHINPGMPVLHVLPYSRLSRPESTVFLESLQPDTIIADEVHKLRHADTATTSRVLRYFANHPGTRFCGWSGSITDSSLRDYAHLAALALRHGSPLPLDPDVVDDWCRVLDPVEVPAPAGKLLDLCAPGEHVVEGFHRRLVETPGVVSTTEPAIDAALEIDERVAPPIPEGLRAMMTSVRATWMRPDGDPILDAMALARCLRELACGFYYRWIFPPVNGAPQRREDIDAWFAARKAWRSELRAKLYQRREHLDSPLLCARAAMRAWGDEPYDGELPVWKADHWPLWRDRRNTVVYETEAVRVDDYLVRDAADWAHSNRGVVWYDKKAFGEWVSEVSQLPMHGGGPGAGERIARERGDRSIIASIQSHGTGRDGLQRLFCTQLVANPQSSATAWEQLLGRLHRIGQSARTVRAEFYRHTPEMVALVDQALARALYVQGTLGLQQKIRTGWMLPELSEAEKLGAVDGPPPDVDDEEEA